MKTIPSEPRSLHVLIIDDNAVLCEALQIWLTHEPGITSVNCQSDWNKAEAEVMSRRPDIILLDIDMPGVNGLDLIAPLSAACPTCKVVMLSGMVSRAMVEKALDEGAAGYMVKDQESRTIVEIIRRAAEGEIALCPTAQAALTGA